MRNDLRPGRYRMSAAAVFLLLLMSSAGADDRARGVAGGIHQKPTGDMNRKTGTSGKVEFPQGVATPSEVCGECHITIYREFALGFGSDMNYSNKFSDLPAKTSSFGSGHAAFAGTIAAPLHAPDDADSGLSCNSCHFPEPFEIPDMENPGGQRYKGRPRGEERRGLTCASCHLTPDGAIRGPYDVKAPHRTVQDLRMRTSAMCAHCHSMGKRVAGRQTQTFLEWRDDFHKPELGRQHCQDCHMFRTLRKSAEKYDVPVRAVARHLWTGGHSPQRVRTALSLVIVQAHKGQPDLEFHVLNIGAGHSVPTGSNRRAVYLRADVSDSSGKTVAAREWMFAPWYGDRPDDKAFIGEDKKRPDAEAAMQADAQGPHEAPVRAGEERILQWAPDLPPGGVYHVKANLVYDLNRYNREAVQDQQTEIYNASLSVKIDAKRK